jgi:hypothetical protein
VPIDLLLNIPQALHALVSLGEWVRETKRRRMVEQSTEGEAMATKITLKTAPGNPSTTKRVSESAKDVSIEINNAVKANERFVILTDADSGKEFSVQPARVLNIEEE